MKKYLKFLFRKFVQPSLLRRKIQSADEVRLIIGASGTGQTGWISTDEHQLNLLRPEVWSSYLGDRKVHAILAEHVWEHLSEADGLLAAKTCFRFLQDGGRLRIAVPDGYFPDKTYIDNVRPMGFGPGAKDHKVLFTVDTLTLLLQGAGFKVQALEYFDQQGQFHFNAWNVSDGMITRSKRYDERNEGNRLGYTSIIVDAIKSNS